MAERLFRCSLRARLLPYALASGVLTSGMLAGGLPSPGFAAARGFRVLLTLTAAACALWLLRKGSELSQCVRLDDKRLQLAYGSRSRTLALEEIEQIKFCAAFSRGRNWLPAAVVVDRAGLEWRLSAFLERGELLVAAIGELGGQGQLAAWIEARGILSAMRATRRRLIVGYGIAIGLPVATLLYGLSR